MSYIHSRSRLEIRLAPEQNKTKNKQERRKKSPQYLNTDKAECAFVVGKETAKVIKIDTDRLAADLVALELEHGPAIYEHNK